MIRPFLSLPALLLTLCGLFLHAEEIPRILPKPGSALSAPEADALKIRLAQLQGKLADFQGDVAVKADAACRVKAVDFALRFSEFYKPEHGRQAMEMLDSAEEILQAAKSQPFTAGPRALGFFSRIDGSPQPYGIEIPEGLDLSKPVPVWIWLHGRSDTETDLHFIRARSSKPGEWKPPGVVILHAFGRQCLGFKGPGETDVLEALDALAERIPVDRDRVVLSGFSMGGAGAWHLGAHFADKWCAVQAGAGFVDVRRYQKLTPEKMPVWYERTLWGQYDVPDSARMFLNTPVIAYSGADDPQKASADIMEETLKGQGFVLPRVIAPKTGHKYTPEALKEITAWQLEATRKGRDTKPAEIHWQSRTLRYPDQKWFRALRLTRHWDDSRADLSLDAEGNLTGSTRNVDAFALRAEEMPARVRSVTLDGQRVSLAGQPEFLEFSRLESGTWRLIPAGDKERNRIASGKTADFQGPVDDIFTKPFLVVEPDQEPEDKELAQWMKREMALQEERWAGAMRGLWRKKKASEITDEDVKNFHLVLWGDPKGNRWIQRTLASRRDLVWNERAISIGEKQVSAAGHVPVMILPNPANPRKYVVINSGPTFRNADDRTNSLQNPKLPDWAILSLQDAPDTGRAGAVSEAGFWDEDWRYSKELAGARPE